MKVLFLKDTVDAAVAIKVSNRTNDKQYFNIRHGSFGKSGFVYYMGIDAKFFAPKENETELKLSQDNFIILPILKKGSPVKDRNDNATYFITRDDMTYHKNDSILFWEIPNRHYREVEYKVSGNALEIAQGVIGKVRDNIEYIVPAPILEITGDATLSWTAIDLDGNLVGQTITYIKESWTVNPIKILTEKKD